MKLRPGAYDLEGNTVVYEGGAYGEDLESLEMIPVEVLEVMGEYLGDIESVLG